MTTQEVRMENKEVRMDSKIEKDSLSSKRLFLVFKRLFDIIITILFSPIILILIIVFAIIVKLDSKGNAFYFQDRIGKDKRVFRIYKLRSMKTDAEVKSGAVWCSEDDPRITRVGSFIRKTRIDELPQFLNVLIGDMSIIGPRPERPELTEQFELETPGFTKRLLVKPGITGLAQINGGYDISHQEKLEYDIKYINNLSVSNEFKILLGSVRVIVTGDGAR